MDTVRRSRIIRLVVIFGISAVALLLATAYVRYGSLAPCDVLRSKLRQESASDKGLAGLVSKHAPDSVIDFFLRPYVGGDLTPYNCARAILSGPQKRSAKVDAPASKPAPVETPPDKALSQVNVNQYGECTSVACGRGAENASRQAYLVCLAKAQRENEPNNKDLRNKCRGVAYDVWRNVGGALMMRPCTAKPEPELDHIWRC